MKKLISKYWKKILIILGIVCMVIILINKATAPKTLIAEYVKYGKVIKVSQTGIDGAVDAAKNNFISVLTGVDPELLRLAFILMIGILAVCVLSFIASSAGKKDAKKK